MIYLGSNKISDIHFKDDIGEIEWGGENVFEKVSSYVVVTSNENCKFYLYYKPVNNTNLERIITDLKSNTPTKIKIPPFTNIQFNYSGSLGGENIETIDLTNLNMSEMTSMENMFGECRSLNKIIGLEDIDTSNITSMYGTFARTNLKTINLSKWDGSNVTTFNSMIWDCKSLINVDISNFSFRRFYNTLSKNNVNNLFYRCYNLQSVKCDKYLPQIFKLHKFSGNDELPESIKYSTSEGWITVDVPE